MSSNARAGARMRVPHHGRVTARFEFYDLPSEVKDQIAIVRAQMAGNLVLLAGYRLQALLAKANFDPSQPRAPRGQQDGGQWTYVPGWAHPKRPPPDSSTPTREQDFGGRRFADPNLTRIALSDGALGFSVDLFDEESRGGHAIRDHVGKRPEALLAIVRADTRSFGFVSYARMRHGSFPSIAAANRLVDSTLAQNREIVAKVASGVQREALVTARFGAKTGIEAYRPSANASPYLRDTFGVGVVIRYDRTARSGYRVVTAYPRQD